MRQVVLASALSFAALAAFARCSSDPPPSDAGTANSDVTTPSSPDEVADNAVGMVRSGRQVFRFDTFGDEAFWGGTIKLQDGIKTISPKTALAVGLKVDVDSLPADVVTALRAGKVDLDSPATTLALLQANAVLGVTGFFDANKNLTSFGVQCAFCHSTVDDSLSPGIGHRLDGWANRDLNVGAIINLAPDLTVLDNLLGAPDATVRAVLQLWGPGKFDAELLLDGKGVRPDGKTAAVLIPPAFGLAGVNLHTWTGWGSVPYWNAFVANLEMHGQGTFFDPRLNDATQFPIAAKSGEGNLRPPSIDEDLITSKLPSLQIYQLTLVVPKPASGTFDANAAARGTAIFDGKAKCATCHVPPLFTEPGWNLHTPAEVGVDDFQANRAPDKRYRTSPLKALFTHTKGGFYHDGRFATLADVVDHYDGFMGLGLTPAEKSDLVEYLKSL